jgi:hypothetical protein
MTITELIEEILNEWAYRVENGMPDPKNPIHVKELGIVLSEMGLSHIKNDLVENLLIEKGKTPEKHVVEADKAFSNPILSKKVSYKDKDGNAKDGIVGNLLRLPKDSPGRVAAEKLLPPEGSPERDAMNQDLGGEGQPKKPEDEKGKEGGEEAPKEDPAKAAAVMFDPKSDPAMGARMDREKDANAQIAKDAEADKQAEKEQEPKKEDEFAPIDSKDVAKEMPQADPETFNGDSDIPDGIEPNDLEQFNTDISKVQQMVADAKAKGEKAPNINLCDVTVPGTNLYCDDNLGIPREEMPQFKGKPQPGTPAAEMAVDENGEVDTEPLFKKMLEEKGIKVVQTEVPSDKLKATQSELVGAKVVGMMGALEENPEHPSITAPIYVSRDGFVIDGHHRWAAIAAYNAKNPDKQIPMKVQVIDQDIKDAIPMCNKFAEEQGVAAKKADANKEGPSEPTKREPANNDPESKAQQFKGKSSGENIQTMEMEGGGLMYGTKHDNTKMVDDILDDVKSKIPKERWKDVVFVGEGGFKNNDGEFEFKGEMDHSASKFKEMGSSVDTWDGDDTDVTNNESPLYKRQEEETGLSNEEVMAANWASMVGQGDSVEDMIPEDYLTDKGKELLKKSAEEANLPLSDTWDSNPTEEDVDSLYRLSFADDNGDKKTKVHDAQVSFNKFRDENLLRKNKELAAQGKIPITIAGESHVDLVDKMTRKGEETSKTTPNEKLPKPEKPSEEDGGVVYSVGGGYYSDKPNGPAQYMASESVVEKVLIEGNINFSHLLFEAAVTKKTSKGNTVKLVTIDPKDQNKATADAAASKGGGWEEPDWMKNAKPGWDAEKVKNKSAWGDEPMQEPDWIKNAKPGWNTKPSPGDAPRNAAPPVGKKVGAVPPPPPPPPPGTKKAGAVPPPPPPPPPPSAPTSAPKLTDKIKQKISKWTEKEKAFFDRNEGAPGSKERRSLGQALKDKAAGAWKAVKKGFKHEVEEFKAAGSAVGKFFKGEEISEHESKAFKSVMFKVVTTAVFGAAFGGLSHGVAAFGKHVAMEFIPHVIGETLLKGVGKAAVFADADGEAETDANMIKFAEMVSKGLEEMEITPEMMEQMVDSYNEKKEGKNTNEMKIESLIKEIISEIKLEAKEGESKKYPGYYHMGGGYYSKKAGGEITHKTVDGGMKALSAKEKAEKNKNQKPASKPSTPPQTVATDKDLQARVSKEKDALNKIEKDKEPKGKKAGSLDDLMNSIPDKGKVADQKNKVNRSKQNILNYFEKESKNKKNPYADELGKVNVIVQKVFNGEKLNAAEKKLAARWIRVAEPTEANPDTSKYYIALEPNNFKKRVKEETGGKGAANVVFSEFRKFMENAGLVQVSATTFGGKKSTANQTFVDEGGKTKILKTKKGENIASVQKDSNNKVSSVTIGGLVIQKQDTNEKGISKEERELRMRNNRNLNEYASKIEAGDMDFIDMDNGVIPDNPKNRVIVIQQAIDGMANRLKGLADKYYIADEQTLSLIQKLSDFSKKDPNKNPEEWFTEYQGIFSDIANHEGDPSLKEAWANFAEVYTAIVEMHDGGKGTQNGKCALLPQSTTLETVDVITISDGNNERKVVTLDGRSVKKGVGGASALTSKCNKSTYKNDKDGKKKQAVIEISESHSAIYDLPLEADMKQHQAHHKQYRKDILDKAKNLGVSDTFIKNIENRLTDPKNCPKPLPKGNTCGAAHQSITEAVNTLIQKRKEKGLPVDEATMAKIRMRLENYYYYTFLSHEAYNHNVDVQDFSNDSVLSQKGDTGGAELARKRKISINSSNGVTILAYPKPEFNVGFSLDGRSSNPGAGRFHNEEKRM